MLPRHYPARYDKRGATDIALEPICWRYPEVSVYCVQRAKAEAVEDFSGLSTKVLKRISTAMAEKVQHSYHS